MKLHDMQTHPREDLRDHPALAPQRPHPVGIAGSSVQQFGCLPVFQWYVNRRPAIWEPHGEPVVILPERVDRDMLLKALRLHRGPIIEADEWRPLADHVLELAMGGHLRAEGFD